MPPSSVARLSPDAEPGADAEPGPATPTDDGAAETSGARGTAAAVVEERLDFERIVGLWPAVLDQVRESGSDLLSTVFAAARPVAVDVEEAVLEVGFPQSAAFNKRKAEAQDARDRFAEAVRTIVGARLRPVYVLLEGSEETESGAEPLSEDELIERLKSEFDAEEFEEAEEAR